MQSDTNFPVLCHIVLTEASVYYTLAWVNTVWQRTGKLVCQWHHCARLNQQTKKLLSQLSSVSVGTMSVWHGWCASSHQRCVQAKNLALPSITHIFQAISQPGPSHDQLWPNPAVFFTKQNFSILFVMS